MTRHKLDLEVKTKPINNIKFGLIIFGLIISIFAAAMDNTIVSTALGKITSEFNGLNQITWVATGYLITNTGFEPLYGKFSDIFGRRTCMLFALCLFLFGSILCGTSTSLIMLIIARVIAGMGGGGLVSLSVIIVSDIVPIHKRGLYMGIVVGNFGFASVVGPLLGGFLADIATWRWAFYINIPICLIAMFLIFTFLKLPNINNNNIKHKLSRIDYLGTFSLLFSIIMFILGLNWGGNEYEWLSLAVLIPIMLSIISASIFIYIELRVAIEPVIPFYIFNQNIILASINAFFNYGCFFGLITYLPIYYQIVHLKSAMYSGIILLPLILGTLFSCIVAGIFTNKTGKYIIITRVGTSISLISIIIIYYYWNLLDLNFHYMIISLLILGFNMGLSFQINTIIAQAAVPSQDHIAIITSFISFCQVLGGIIGISLLGTVHRHILLNFLYSHLPSHIKPEQFLHSTEFITNIQLQPYLPIVNQGYIQSFNYVILASIPLLAICFISTLFLKHIPLVSASNNNNDNVTSLDNITTHDI